MCTVLKGEILRITASKIIFYSKMLYTRYPIVARALGLAAARAKVSCIQSKVLFIKSKNNAVGYGCALF